MITGLILPAIAAFLLFFSFKTTDGFQLANGIAAVLLVLALILNTTYSWGPTVAFATYLFLIVGLMAVIAYAHFME